MAQLYQILPELDLQEMNYIQALVKNFNEQQLVSFSQIYRSRRRDPQLILLTALLGFVGIAGVHRFLTEQIGMGVLYVFTGGLCFIGTIVDLVNYRQLAFDYNIKIGNEVAGMISRSAL
jgi:TM2 domain-containing membrane protein YozV